MPEGNSSKEHIEELKPHDSHKPGCVTKCIGTRFSLSNVCSYRGNGYKESKANRTDLYHIDFTEAENAVRLPYIFQELRIGSKDKLIEATNPKLKKDAWHFKGENYKKAYLPFNHNYHHILPFESLKRLSFDELKLLQQSGYNLNHEVNMIILPCLYAYGIAMKLPSHPRGHKVYSRSVKNIVQILKQKIVRNSEGHKINSDNMGDLKKYLEDWEQKQFKVLVQYGQEEIAKRDPMDPVDDNHVNGSPMSIP